VKEKIITQLRIIKFMKMKPNFSALSREYGFDRRTIKKYYEGYEGKPLKRNKESKLDKYKELIIQKFEIRGITVKAVYEYFIDKECDIGSYSDFNKYIKKNGLKPASKIIGHPRFERLPGKQSQIDWKHSCNK